MKIRRIARRNRSEEPLPSLADAFVFLVGDKCFAVASEESGKILMRNCDADGVRKFIEDAERGFDKRNSSPCDRKTVKVKSCRDGTWDVWFDGVYLCRTVDRTGAFAIKHVLESLVAEGLIPESE